MSKMVAKLLLICCSTSWISPPMLPELSMEMMMSTGLTCTVASYGSATQGSSPPWPPPAPVVTKLLPPAPPTPDAGSCPPPVVTIADPGA